MPRRRKARTTQAQRPRLLAGWPRFPKERLLDTRLCDLGLKIEQTPIAESLAELYRELEQRGFVFRPHCWLSEEWFSPDGVPGFAIPFFLAHPRLKRLEQEFMLEVEGADHDECLDLMRHETGHALANAYRLHRRRDWQQHFGHSSQKYPKSYLPHPYSKRFVIHLENWYAQSHPDEDWAETFAVWLKPDSDWHRRYRGWPALRKLEYVDTLMAELHDKRPLVGTRLRQSPVNRLRLSLRRYYERKQVLHGTKRPEFLDRDLRRLFSNDVAHRANETAGHYLRRHRSELTAIVSRWTSEYRYRIDQVLREMVKRCDELRLHITRDDHEMKLEATAFLTRLVMDYLHTGRFRVSV
jgi:hypothetical protein